MNFSNLEKPNKEEINTLKGEHLKEGISPIMGGIYNDKELMDEDNNFFNEFKKNATFVNFKSNPDEASRNRFLNSGKETYVISAIDKTNKYSKDFYSCTSVYGVGIDKDTGENISFVTHQDPDKFLKNTNIQNDFKDDLCKTIDELTSRSIPGSVDVVLLGGNKNISYADPINSIDMDKMTPQQAYNFIEQQDSGPMDKYRRSIKYMGKIISDKLNFIPVVITGPNSNVKENDFTHSNELVLYFDTQNRRVFQVRPRNDSKNNESFSSSDVDKKIHDYK